MSYTPYLHDKILSITTGAPTKMRASFWLDAHAYDRKTTITPLNISNFKYWLNTYDGQVKT